MVSGLRMCLYSVAQVTVWVSLFDLQLLIFAKWVIKVFEMSGLVPEGLFYDEVWWSNILLCATSDYVNWPTWVSPHSPPHTFSAIRNSTLLSFMSLFKWRVSLIPPAGVDTQTITTCNVSENNNSISHLKKSIICEYFDVQTSVPCVS